MFNLGPTEWLVILVIVLVIFGPKRLPDLGRSVGGALREFRQAAKASRPEEEEGAGESPAAHGPGAQGPAAGGPGSPAKAEHKP